jgi:hypothetical protein
MIQQVQQVKSPSIADLLAELVSVVGALPEFEDRKFSIYDMDDMAEKAGMQTTPIVGVGYESMDPSDLPDQRTTPARNIKPTVLFTQVTFTILVGIEYSVQAETDTKPIATDLLDAMRRCLIGFKGVNGKPWRFAGERPIGSDDRGVIWYGQLWQTDVLNQSSK